MTGFDFSTFEGFSWVKTAVATTSSMASSYIVGNLYGEDPHFSWTALAGNIVGSGLAGNLLDGMQFGLGDIYGGLTNASLSGIAGAAINDKWFGGSRPDYVQVAANAAASFVGNRVGNVALQEARERSLFGLGAGSAAASDALPVTEPEVLEDPMIASNPFAERRGLPGFAEHEEFLEGLDQDLQKFLAANSAFDSGTIRAGDTLSGIGAALDPENSFAATGYLAHRNGIVLGEDGNPVMNAGDPFFIGGYSDLSPEQRTAYEAYGRALVAESTRIANLRSLESGSTTADVSVMTNGDWHGDVPPSPDMLRSVAYSEISRGDRYNQWLSQTSVGLLGTVDRIRSSDPTIDRGFKYEVVM